MRYYRSFSSYLKDRYGEKVFRISIDAGFTCPNRDGTLGRGGCAYCSPYGSWDRHLARKTLNEQVREGKERIRRRYGANRFIAYFQAYTNTYAPINELKRIYDSVVRDDSDFVAIAIGTRPDCIDEEKLKMIAEYREMGLDVWIEYGLQSAKSETLKLIRRGHDVDVFEKAVLQTKKYGILVSAHVIIGLPGEDREDIVNTARFLSELPIDGIKLHNLNIVKGTLMEKWYMKGKVRALELEEYASLAVDFLELLPPDVVVQRLIAETDREFLIAPEWVLNKSRAIEYINNTFKERKSYQGILYPGIKTGGVKSGNKG